MPDTSSMTEPEARAVFENGFRQLHGCLEDHREETRKAFKTLGAKLGELTVSQTINNGVTTALAKRLGVNGLDVKDDGKVEGVEKVKAAVGAWSVRDMLVKGLPLVGSAFVLLQFLFLVTPGVAKAIYQAVMNLPG